MRITLSTLLAVAMAAAAECATKDALESQAAQFANYRGAQDAPTYRAPVLESAPVVDGELDDVYGAAEPIEFVLINGDKRQPDAPTTAYVGCTTEALHVFFRCAYSDPGAATWSRRKRDSDVWNDNCVEVFLNPTGGDGTDYYQITLNPGGTVADSLARDHKAWDPTLKVATQVKPDRWTAELAIPFEQLGLTEKPFNKVWRMNLTRVSQAPYEDTSWCVLGDYNSHVPGRFGYLWVDAGRALNVSTQDMQPWKRLFDGKSLAGWRAHDGKLTVGAGAMAVGANGRAKILLTEPLPYADVAISIEVYYTKQIRFMFSPDEANEQMGCYATFINFINESNVALLRRWDYWQPPLGGHLTIPHYGPCPMQDDNWHRCEVRFRPDRIQLLLDGRLLLETPNFYPQARYFGLDIIDAGKVRNVRLRRLVSEP